MKTDPRTGLPILHPGADEKIFEEILRFAFGDDEVMMAAYHADRLGEVEERLKPWIHGFGNRGELADSHYRAAAITPERIFSVCANPDQVKALIALGRDGLKYGVAERLYYWLTQHDRAVRDHESRVAHRDWVETHEPMLA